MQDLTCSGNECHAVRPSVVELSGQGVFFEYVLPRCMHFYFFEGRIVTGAAMGKINPDTSQSYTIMTMTYDAMHLNMAFPGWTSTMLEQAVANVASGTASGYAATLRPLRVGHTAAQVVPTFLRSGCWTLTALAKLEVRVHLKERTAKGSFVEVKAARLLYHASGNNLIQSGDSFTFQDIPYWLLLQDTCAGNSYWTQVRLCEKRCFEADNGYGNNCSVEGSYREDHVCGFDEELVSFAAAEKNCNDIGMKVCDRTGCVSFPGQ